MINHGFRRLALAHSLLPADRLQDRADTPSADSVSLTLADEAEKEPPEQDELRRADARAAG